MEQSHRFHAESLAIARDIGSRWLTGWVFASRGWLARAEGDTTEALARTRDVLRLLRDTASQDDIASALLLAGVLAIEDGLDRRGTCLLAHADVYRTLRMFVMPLREDWQARDRCVAAARAHLGDDDFARAWAAGQAMTLEQAIAYALEDDSSPDSSPIAAVNGGT